MIAACSAGDTPRTEPTPEGRTSQTAAASTLDTSSPARPKRVFLHTTEAARVVAAREMAPLAFLQQDGDGDGDGDDRFPAFRPNVPQLIENGGATLRRPRVVSITWDEDPARDQIEAFGDELGGSRYWRAAVGEYGVEGAWSGKRSHVHLSPPLTGPIPFRQVIDTLRANVTNAPASGWPEWGPETIYTVYMPPGIGVTFGGDDICQSNVGGWHEDIPLDPTADAGSKDLLYAIIFRCPAFNKDGEATFVASHELAESATDPYPNTKTALAGYDPDHLAYEFTQQYNDENGDACEFFPTSRDAEVAPFPFTVQRTWSNRAARRGLNPCAPRASDAYFNVTPLGRLDDLTLDLTAVGGAPGTKTKGIKATLGQPRTFSVGFFSDRPASDWTLTALTSAYPGWSHLGYLTDDSGTPIANGQVTVAIDQPTGGNGHVAHVTVTPTVAGAVGGEWIVLRSLASGVASDPARPMLNDLPLFIAQQ